MNRALALAFAAALIVAAVVTWALLDDSGTGADGVDPAGRRTDELESMIDVEGEAPEAGSGAVAPSSVGLAGTGTTVERGPVTIHVIDAFGGEVPSVRVGIGPPAATALADIWGQATFDDVAYDGTVSANVSIEHDDQTLVVGDPKPIEGPRVWLRLADVVPVVVQVEDAEIGDLLDPQPVRLEVNRPVLSDDDLNWGAATRAVYLPPASRVDTKVIVDVPEGYVAPRITRYSAKRSPYAYALIARVPLRRELSVEVLVRDHKGNACPEAVIAHVTAAGTMFRDPASEIDGFGNRRVRGIPFYAREPISVWVELPGTTAWASGKSFMSTDPRQVVAFTLDLPEPEEMEGPENNPSIGIGGGVGGAFRGRGGRRRPLPQGRVRIHVKRFNGAPAVDAIVDVGGRKVATDENGVATLEHVAPGTYKVAVDQFGLIPIRGQIEVTDTITAELTLTEAKGARLELTVVDELDRPLPYAEIQLRRGGRVIDWPHVEGNIQRLDPFTDHRGRRTYERLPTSVESIRVIWGSRDAALDVQLEDGETKRLTIQVGARPGAPR